MNMGSVGVVSLTFLGVAISAFGLYRLSVRLSVLSVLLLVVVLLLVFAASVSSPG